MFLQEFQKEMVEEFFNKKDIKVINQDEAIAYRYS